MNKSELRRFLFDGSVKVLEDMGYRVERIPRAGKSSLRKITKDDISKKVSIRTSQDTWFAFSRSKNDKGWDTLEDVDYVIVASVDNPNDHQMARIHMIDATDVRNRFDRAYKARKEAGYVVTPGAGFWVSLYGIESSDVPHLVGAGAGLGTNEIAHFPLLTDEISMDEVDELDIDPHLEGSATTVEPLTIPEAKRRLAMTLGIGIEDIKITITN